MWLHFQYNFSSCTMDFFHNRETGTTRCLPPEITNPRVPIRILTTESLEEQLRELTQKLSVLERSSAAAQAAAGPSSSSVGGKSSSAFSSGQQELLEGPAQVTRYGGHEAAAHSAIAGASSGSFVSGPQPAASTEPAKKPGHIPWTTFQQASWVLIGIWILGTVWSFLYCLFDIEIPLDPLPNAPGENALLPTEVAFAGEWPHPFFAPRGVACHPALGTSALVAETYGVHRLRHGLLAEAHLQPDLIACLSQAPDFHASGINGISIDCPEDSIDSSKCVAVLLSSSGQAALRCSLEGQGLSMT